jgi:hypothetical protein
MVTMLLVGGVIPLVVLIALNTKIYIAIKERLRRLATLTSRQKRYIICLKLMFKKLCLSVICHF